MARDVYQSWRVFRLGEIAAINPSTPLPTLKPDHRVSFVPMSAVSETTANVEALETRRFDEVQRGFVRFVEGDLLLARITPSLENGKVAIASQLVEPRAGFGSTEFHVVRPTDKVSRRWLWYFLRQPSVRRVLQAQMTGSTGQQRVPADAVRSLKVALPSLAEQGQLCDLLDDVDAARRLRSSASAKITRASDTLFDEALGRAAAAGRWEKSALGDAKYFEGFAYGTSVKSQEYPSDDRPRGAIPVLRIPNVLRGQIDPTDLKYAVVDDAEVRRLRLRRGDVLIVRSNGNPEYVGRSAAYAGEPADCVFASYLIRLRPRLRHFDGDYLAAWLRSPAGRQALLRDARTTSGIFNLSAAQLAKIAVPRPPVTRQREFASELHTLRSASALQVAHEAKLDRLFYGLIAAVFRGEVPVRSGGAAAKLLRPARPEVDPPQGLAVERLLATTEEGVGTLGRGRYIWHSLSKKQRSVWKVCDTFPRPFTVQDIRSALIAGGTMPPSDEHLRGMLDLLVTIGAVIREERDGEFWRRPLSDIDEQVQV